MTRDWTYDIAVIGAGGHVGLPLSLALTDSGFSVVGIEIDDSKIDDLKQGRMPFNEPGCEDLLQEHATGESPNLLFSKDYDLISESETIVIVPGTPLTNEFTPDMSQLNSVLKEMIPRLQSGHLIILRSTVSPGTTDQVAEHVRSAVAENISDDLEFVFAPERIVEGKAIDELHKLPQVIGSYNEHAFERTCSIFKALGVECIRVTPLEAELSKLFANNFRYVQFALANELFSICESKGVNFERVRKATNHNYPRSRIPSSGFARGPCLGKDLWLLTGSLASFAQKSSILTSAYLTNEGLPHLALEIAREELGTLTGKNVLILGLTYKRDSDDLRESLVSKLHSLIEKEFPENIDTHDPYVSASPLKKMVSKADIIFLGTNHSVYDDSSFLGHARDECLVVDVWHQLAPSHGHAFYCGSLDS